MKIYPAIDILDGACVRLRHGDFSQKTIYHSSPLAMAQMFVAAGAEAVHIVDLKGSLDGQSKHRHIIKTIASTTRLHVQTGGGIRKGEDVGDLLDGGVAKVVIGSLAQQDLVTTLGLIEHYGADRITLAADVRVRDGIPWVAVSGWEHTTPCSLWDFLGRYDHLKKLPQLLCTDIGRDGDLTGPNTTLYKELAQRFPHWRWQGSGGVSQLSDLSLLRQLGAEACIVGKALYEGRFTLEEALAC